MVRDLGLSDVVGPVGYADPAQQEVPPALRSRPFAEATQRAMDEEVASMLRRAVKRASTLLETHRDALEELVDRLLDEEVVDGEVVYGLVDRSVPAPPDMATGRLRTEVADDQ